MKLEKDLSSQFLDKNKYNNKIISFEITDVTEEFDDVYIHLKEINTDNEPKKLKLNKSLRNGCIEEFGEETDDWKGNSVKIAFNDWEPPEGSKASSGVAANYISKEEDMTA